MVGGVGGNPNSQAFEVGNANAQVTDLDLAIGQAASENTFTLNYPLQGNLTLSPNSTAPLTLVIDINRMLRFYVTENRPGGFGPNTPGNDSYFYNSVFDSSVYLFAGRHGSILGYQLVAGVCVDQNGTVPPVTNPNAYDCSTLNNSGTPVENVGTVAAWLTVVEDPNGLPFVFNFMPDDDDALTVIKGSNQTMNGLAQNSVVVNGDGTYNLTYTLDQNSVGTVYNVDTTMPLNALDTNVLFHGFNTGWFSGPSPAVNVPSYGYVSTWRRL